MISKGNGDTARNFSSNSFVTGLAHLYNLVLSALHPACGPVWRGNNTTPRTKPQHSNSRAHGTDCGAGMVRVVGRHVLPTPSCCPHPTCSREHPRGREGKRGIDFEEQEEL